MYQSCELVFLKGGALYLFLVNLIVYGDVRHDILTMVDMNHIERSQKKNCITLVQLCGNLSTFFDKVLLTVNSYSMFCIFPGRVDKGNCNTVIDVPW